MALIINGVGQDTFSMNGVTIDNLYVDEVLVWSLDTSIAPNAPTDFVASDDLVGEITFTWTNSTVGNPTPTYDIYISGGALVVSGVTSPHTEAIVAGTADYIVRAVNSEGTADSNVDSGTSVVHVELPPIYELTEPLIDFGGFKWLVNSAEGATTYNGKLLTSGDTTWDPGSDYVPSEARIDFGENKADTEYTEPSSTEQTLTYVYDVVFGSSYKICSVHNKGNGVADVYYGDESTPMTLTAENTNINYDPAFASGTVIIDSYVLQKRIPMIPTCEITMSQYTFSEGETATVTFTMSTIPVAFSLGDITAENGALSNFQADSTHPWIYTATFTPTPDVSDDTNVITFNGTPGCTDYWGNNTNADFESANYTVDTVVAPTLPSPTYRWTMDTDETEDVAGLASTEYFVLFGDPGKFNNCATFNGTSSRIDHAIPPPAVDIEYSVSFYMKRNATASGQQTLIGFGAIGTTTSAYPHIYIDDGILGVSNTSSATYSSKWATSINTDVYHVAVNMKRGNYVPKIYVNGVPSTTLHDDYWSGEALFGSSRSGASNTFDGWLDHIEYFDRWLTDEEALALSNRTAP